MNCLLNTSEWTNNEAFRRSKQSWRSVNILAINCESTPIRRAVNEKQQMDFGEFGTTPKPIIHHFQLCVQPLIATKNTKENVNLGIRNKATHLCGIDEV